MGQSPTSEEKLLMRRSANAITSTATVGVNIMNEAMTGSFVSYIPLPSHSGAATAHARLTLRTQNHTMLHTPPILNFGNLTTPTQTMTSVHF